MHPRTTSKPARLSYNERLEVIIGLLGLAIAAGTFLYGDELLCKVGAQFSSCQKADEQTPMVR